MSDAVLVVDDSLTVRMDLEEVLRAAGYETRTAATLAEARAALAAPGVSLVILDLLLPDGDGLDFLREVRAADATRALPVLLLSTEAEVRDRVRGMATGASDFVGKPYEPSVVVARVDGLLRRTEPAAEGAARRRILVIEDSVTFRETLKGALERAGYAVEAASSGEEGLRLAYRSRPDGVVVDGLLPGMDGAAVIRRIREDAGLRRAPVLMLTGSPDPGGELRALDSGADAYVRKDVDFGEILARLGAILRAAHAAAGPPAPFSALGPKRVLAVDDSRTFLEELAGRLREDGYEVVAASSGEEALTLLRAQAVDCIVLDLVMPGLSGREVCRRVKEIPEWRDVPLIMLTALEEREAMIEGINAGADDYIAKSADFGVLKARLRAQLRRKQFEDENRQIREQLLRRGMEAAEANAARDLAETRARLLAELEEKNRELEAFSFSVSHDLQAPLRGVEGFTEALEEECGAQLSPDGRRYLGIVKESAARMRQLIGDLLEFSRMGGKSMEFDEVDMTALARESYDQATRGQPDRRIEFLLEPLPAARGDAAMIRQVFLNLLSNAVKYTSRREGARIGVAARREAREAVYSVRDNGVGFDPRHADRLFRVFQRLHSASEFEGTGVGLALAARIVRRHGGRIWAESTPGEGAAFHFSLPLREAP